ncbi:MAG TPA: hypothetical protein VHQ65_00310 [Thermoanaerobaculia bacterium]|nr:hypothetical protein [Thermoanaerobaculia bacterium]
MNSTTNTATWMPVAVVFLMLATLAPLGACARAEVDVEDAEDLAQVDGEQDLNPVEAALAIDDVAIGSALGEEGAIVDGSNDEFAPGDPIYVAMEVGDARPGTEVRIDWFGPGDRQVETESKSIAEGDRYLNFQAPDTARWSGGEYRAEVWYGNERVDALGFRIQPVDPGRAEDATAETETGTGAERNAEAEVE